MSALLAIRIPANEVAADREEAGRCVDLPIEDAAADDQISLGPDPCDAIPEQRIKIDVAVDRGVRGVVADGTTVTVIFVK